MNDDISLLRQIAGSDDLHDGELQRFLRAVEPYIYIHRWGDAPIQSIALRLFSEPSRVKFIGMDYTHLSTKNEIKNGKEVPMEAEGKIETFIPKTFMFFMAAARERIAPCSVAEHYALPGAPFTRLIDAVDALKGALMLAFNLSKPIVEIYSPWELAKAVQYDLMRDPRGPLPTDNVTGLALRDALAALLSSSPNATDADLVDAACKHKCLGDVGPFAIGSKVPECHDLAHPRGHGPASRMHRGRGALAGRGAAVRGAVGRGKASAARASRLATAGHGAGRMRKGGSGGGGGGQAAGSMSKFMTKMGLAGASAAKTTVSP